MKSGFSHRLKSFIVFVLICFCQLTVLAQTDWTCGGSKSCTYDEGFAVLYRQLPNYPFVFVSDSMITSPPVISDSLFDEIARGIKFEVNRTEIKKDDPFISLYNDSLLPLVKKNNLVLREVFVKGAASPEGPFDNNVRLSCERTKRLIEFLNSNEDYPAADYPVNAKCVTEDYAYLVKLMEQAGDVDYKKVKDVWEKCNNDERLCKQMLMALNGGRTWKRLLKQYFPTLRQSRVVLWYVAKPCQISTPSSVSIVDSTAMELPAQSGETIEDVSSAESIKEYSRRHMIAVRTNLLHDFLYVPQFGFAPGGNIQVEYYPLSGNYTFNAGFTFTDHKHWDVQKFMQIRDFQLSVRRYFKGRGEFVGPYVDGYAEFMKYGIGFGPDKGWQGEGGGAGLGCGYTWNLNKRGNLRLELSLNLGFFVTRYDPYVWGDSNGGDGHGLYYYDYHGSASDFKERNHRFFWLGPTNAGVHITYDIIYRKQKKEGSR